VSIFNANLQTLNIAPFNRRR